MQGEYFEVLKLNEETILKTTYADPLLRRTVTSRNHEQRRVSLEA